MSKPLTGHQLLAYLKNLSDEDLRSSIYTDENFGEGRVLAVERIRVEERDMIAGSRKSQWYKTVKKNVILLG